MLIALLIYLIGVLCCGAVIVFLAILGNGMRLDEFLKAVAIMFLWPIALPSILLYFFYKAFISKKIS